MTEEVRILVSGTAHRAFVEDGIVFSAEADNLDASGDRTIVHPSASGLFAYPVEADMRRLCIRCFGRRGAVRGEDGERCTEASGHLEGHAFGKPESEV